MTSQKAPQSNRPRVNNIYYSVLLRENIVCVNGFDIIRERKKTVMGFVSKNPLQTGVCFAGVNEYYFLSCQVGADVKHHRLEFRTKVIQNGKKINKTEKIMDGSPCKHKACRMQRSCKKCQRSRPRRAMILKREVAGFEGCVWGW